MLKERYTTQFKKDKDKSKDKNKQTEQDKEVLSSDAFAVAEILEDRINKFLRDKK